MLYHRHNRPFHLELSVVSYPKKYFVCISLVAKWEDNINHKLLLVLKYWI